MEHEPYRYFFRRRRSKPVKSPAQMRPPQQQPQQLQHDSCYQLSEMGRVSAEMVRPTVAPGDFGGYDVEMLRVAALARTMLIRLKYLHICSPVYCLKERERFHRLLARLAVRALRTHSAPVSTRGSRLHASHGCARSDVAVFFVLLSTHCCAEDRPSCRFFFPWPHPELPFLGS